MDMNDTSQGNTFDKEDPRKTTPPGSPRPTETAQPQDTVADTLKDVEHPIIVTAPNIEKYNPKVLTAKNVTPPANPLSQEEMDALKKENPRAYTKMVLSSKGNFTDRCSSSLTII